MYQDTESCLACNESPKWSQAQTTQEKWTKLQYLSQDTSGLLLSQYSPFFLCMLDSSHSPESLTLAFNTHTQGESLTLAFNTHTPGEQFSTLKHLPRSPSNRSHENFTAIHSIVAFHCDGRIPTGGCKLANGPSALGGNLTGILVCQWRRASLEVNGLRLETHLRSGKETLFPGRCPCCTYTSDLSDSLQHSHQWNASFVASSVAAANDFLPSLFLAGKACLSQFFFSNTGKNKLRSPSKSLVLLCINWSKTLAAHLGWQTRLIKSVVEPLRPLDLVTRWLVWVLQEGKFSTL